MAPRARRKDTRSRLAQRAFVRIERRRSSNVDAKVAIVVAHLGRSADDQVRPSEACRLARAEITAHASFERGDAAAIVRPPQFRHDPRAQLRDLRELIDLVAVRDDASTSPHLRYDDVRISAARWTTTELRSASFVATNCATA